MYVRDEKFRISLAHLICIANCGSLGFLHAFLHGKKPVINVEAPLPLFHYTN